MYEEPIGGIMTHRWTTMSVHKDVYEKVANQKDEGESFNDVIERLCQIQESGNTDF